MTSSTSGRRGVLAASAGVVVVLVLAAGAFGALLLTSTASAGPTVSGTPASSTSEKWAFGGSESSMYSCSNAHCFGGTAPPNISSYSLSWKLYIEWVVIYTQTNVSDSQTEFEGQTALNVSVSYSFSECVNVTLGKPCQSESISASLIGRESATGFTNVTAGTVDLIAGAGSPASVPALAITDASSQESFNVSGAFSIESTNVTVPSENDNFDFGGSESSSIAFSSPFGLVPTDPVPGDNWTSSAPYTAEGKYIAGYSLSGTENGTTVSVAHWTPGSVSSSGTLMLNGSDIASVTLYDNYTHPPTTVTGQLVVLDFVSGNFSAADGWILTPTQLYGGLLSSFGLVGSAGHAVPAASARSSSSSGNLSSNEESAYYEHGAGFIGAGLAGNASGLSGAPGSPSIQLTAGPEPLSVAQGQYSAITDAGAGSGGFPLLLVLAVVVAGAVVVVGVLAWRRSVQRRPPSGPGTP